MINLMYLVLTAMLALNVSSEILHAFRIINDSIGKSNESIEGKNNEYLTSLEGNMNMKGHEDRVRPYYERAKAVHEKSLAMYSYLEDWKKKVVAEADQITLDKVNLTEIKREDNIDASTRLLVEKKGGNEVKAKLEELRAYMLEQIQDEKIKDKFGKDFPLQITMPPKSDNNPSGDWSTGTFYNVPTLAAVTLFAKMQNDIRNSESMILSELSREADAKPLKFDAITAIAVPKNSYVLAGQPVEAQIMFAAYNTAVKPDISASAGAVTVDKGVGTWKGTASGVGLQTVRGHLSVNMGDHIENQDWSFQYMVGSAGGSMQLDKMNVFYIGVANPVTVTAAGYTLEDVSLSIPGATVTATGKGKYDVMVTQATGPKVTATINARTAAGARQVGAMEVRVKRIPDPIAKVAGKTGGVIAANAFRAQLGVAAILENFDFDIKYTITSFEFGYQARKKDYQPMGVVNGALFSTNPQVANYIRNQAAIGDRVFFDNIRAKGPDGTTRALPSLTFLLN